jgi:hypothetical protein
VEPEAAPETLPAEVPTPESRQRSGAIDGIPVVMGDGQTWLLGRCGLARGLSPVRDSLFNSLIVYQEATLADLSTACWYALAVNYDLSEAELTALIRSTSLADEAVLDAIMDAVLPTVEDREMGYTDWARSALLSNGLKPADVPAADLRGVLSMLVATGRAVAAEKFTDSGRHAAAVGSLRALKPRDTKARDELLKTE